MDGISLKTQEKPLLARANVARTTRIEKETKC